MASGQRSRQHRGLELEFGSSSQAAGRPGRACRRRARGRCNVCSDCWQNSGAASDNGVLQQVPQRGSVLRIQEAACTGSPPTPTLPHPTHPADYPGRRAPGEHLPGAREQVPRAAVHQGARGAAARAGCQPAARPTPTGPPRPADAMAARRMRRWAPTWAPRATWTRSRRPPPPSTCRCAGAACRRRCRLPAGAPAWRLRALQLCATHSACWACSACAHVGPRHAPRMARRSQAARAGRLPTTLARPPAAAGPGLPSARRHCRGDAGSASSPQLARCMR
jgi:hypothetical protein